MSLHFNLKVRNTTIATMEINRLTHGEKRIEEPEDDAKYTYMVYINDHLIGEVDHRYGDGPWALLQKATTLAMYHPSGDYVCHSGVRA